MENKCTHCSLIGDFHTANHSYPITPALNAQKMQIDFAIIHFFAPRATSDYSDSCCFFNGQTKQLWLCSYNFL